MASSKEFDLLYLLRILEASEKIRIYSKGFTDPIDFFEANDQREFNACLSLLAQIGEQANKISTETKQKYPDLDWGNIYGYRNRIVHDYTGIDKFLTFEIIVESVPALIDSISNLIRVEVRNGSLSLEDFNLSKQSPYLKHIDFGSIQ
jgi:uncharacterized protein with HEPN domain